MISLHDRDMQQYLPFLATDSFGHTVRYYQLKKSDAAWDIIFIHGTPATAKFLHEVALRLGLQADASSGHGLSDEAKQRIVQLLQAARKD